MSTLGIIGHGYVGKSVEYGFYGHDKERGFEPKHQVIIYRALEGINAVSAIRLIVGPTKAWEANAGTIRGDFSLSTQSNIVHASESFEAGEIEVKRFFNKEEIFEYQKIDTDFVYAEHKD